MNIKEIQQTFATLPKWLQWLLLTIKSLLLFIIIWIALTHIFGLFQSTPQHKPSEYFRVCVIQDNKPNMVQLNERNSLPLCEHEYVCVVQDNKPKIVLLNERKGLSLCQDKYGYLESGLYSFNIKQINIKNNEWEITSWNDSMGDPLIYRYQIDNDKVTPSWWSHGGMMRTSNNIFFAFIFTFLVLKIMTKVTTYFTNKHVNKS